MLSGSGFPHFAISLPPTAPDGKSNSNSQIAGYIRQLPGSPLPSRHPPLQHLPHHHTLPRPSFAQARLRVPRGGGAPGSGEGARQGCTAQTWRPPLSQARQPRRHSSSLIRWPQHFRFRSAGRAKAPLPFQAASRTMLLTMVADGDGFSQADPSEAGRADDGGDEGGRDR